MGFKAVANFSAGRGLDFLVGAPYSGPVELIETLLAAKLIASDESTPMPSGNYNPAEDKALDDGEEVELVIDEEVIESKPKKSRKKK